MIISVTKSEEQGRFWFHVFHNVPLELHHHFQGMIDVAQ